MQRAITGPPRQHVITASDGALFTEDRKYRYLLTRHHVSETGEGYLIWVMLNPSTADEVNNDPTVRRCAGFTKSLGYKHMIVLNAFALVSPDPKDLLSGSPVGPSNDRFLEDILRHKSKDCLVAWGSVHKDLVDRIKHVQSIVRRNSMNVYCLGKNADGTPKHPLYLKKATKLEPFFNRKKVKVGAVDEMNGERIEVNVVLNKRPKKKKKLLLSAVEEKPKKKILVKRFL